MLIPKIVGEWKILYEPKIYGNYVNDHTIIKDENGKWHLYGITSFDTSPSQERYFTHGVGEDLNVPFREVGKTIDKGTLAWAPCVIKEKENFYMFYGPSPTQLAVSFDNSEWFGYRVNMKNEPPMVAHRDHFVLKIAENSFLMYVVGIYNKKSAISVFSSSDLINWEYEGIALSSGEKAPLNPSWGAMESPFVVHKNGLYYLFTTYTDCSTETYSDTLVFVSSNPKSFGQYNGGYDGAIPITKLQAHAPEIIMENGEYYITTCGWLCKPLPNKGAVSIAKLVWEEK